MSASQASSDPPAAEGGFLRSELFATLTAGFVYLTVLAILAIAYVL